MKTLAAVATLLGIWLSASNQPAGLGAVGRSHEATPRSEGTAVDLPSARAADLNDVVQQYCVRCHSDRRLSGNLSLESFDVDAAHEGAETAERMILKLRAGMMPPPGERRPSADTLLALVETLESLVDEAASRDPNLPGRRFQRLSRAEYERAIRDVLALEVDAGDWLPTDVILMSFDNMADAQALSTTLLGSYMRAGAEISRLAVGNPKAVSKTTKLRNPSEVSQHSWDRLEGAPFGTRGGMVLTHHFPADGEYVFQVETRFGEGSRLFHDIDISVAGEPAALIKLPQPGSGGRRGGGDVSYVVESIQTEPVLVPAGQHTVAVAFVRRIEGPYEDRLSPTASSSTAETGSHYGLTVPPQVTEVLITGPRNVTGVSETESRRKIFTCYPSSSAEARPCAESILTELATRAFRRPVTSEDVAELIAFYDEAAAGEGFEIGVRTGLQVILSSPEFLFRLEGVPDDARPGESYRLSELDLAERLSFFLWSTVPDEELIEVAASGRLSDPAVLEQQVRRMLDDPRSEALATRFAHQWLRLQDVGRVWPDPYLYPEFSQQLVDVMVRETQLLFMHLVEEDRSLLELFGADYTFVNDRLARHYGIEGVSGAKFRRVDYPNDQRRGILGHGSVLVLTSMAVRTSPVMRGKWVMEVLMGTPPPPPPPNIPTFDASPLAVGGRRLTTRERMEAHRADPVCASCHRFMDPIGLALDNFDVAGKWRIRENMAPLDTRGTFYDGTQISQPKELAEVLLSRPIPLVRNFTEHLLSYAIGRPAEYLDQPTVRAIASAAAENDYRMTSFILGVVESDLFQMRQAQPTANN